MFLHFFLFWGHFSRNCVILKCLTTLQLSRKLLNFLRLIKINFFLINRQIGIMCDTVIFLTDISNKNLRKLLSFAPTQLFLPHFFLLFIQNNINLTY